MIATASSSVFGSYNDNKDGSNKLEDPFNGVSLKDFKKVKVDQNQNERKKPSTVGSASRPIFSQKPQTQVSKLASKCWKDLRVQDQSRTRNLLSFRPILTST